MLSSFKFFRYLLYNELYTKTICQSLNDINALRIKLLLYLANQLNKMSYYLAHAELWCLTRKLELATDSNITISRFSINIHCIPCLRNFLWIFFLSFLCFICVTEWNEKNSLCRIRKVIFCCQVWMYFYFSVFSNATKKFHFKSALFPDSSKDKRIFTRPKTWNTKLQTFFT